MNDNKLIAEFMGFQKTDIGWYDSNEIVPPMSNTYDGNTFDEHELSFERSWDWLMPVIQKILDISFQDDGDAEDFNCIIDCIPDINQTYKAVIEFIKEKVK